MLKALGSRLTYANVMATVAVFLALGGGAYALSGIPDRGGIFHGCASNAGGTLRVVKSASSCQRARTVRRHGRRVRVPGESAISWNQQGRPGLRGVEGQQGVQGQRGIQGFRGATGDPGPSDTWDASLSSGAATVSLPPGRFVAYGAVSFHNSSSSVSGGDQCSWLLTTSSNDTVTHFHAEAATTSVLGPGDASTANSMVVEVDGPDSFQMVLQCPSASDAQLTATKVGALH